MQIKEFSITLQYLKLLLLISPTFDSEPLAGKKKAQPQPEIKISARIKQLFPDM